MQQILAPRVKDYRSHAQIQRLSNNAKLFFTCSNGLSCNHQNAYKDEPPKRI